MNTTPIDLKLNVASFLDIVSFTKFRQLNRETHTALATEAAFEQIGKSYGFSTPLNQSWEARFKQIRHFYSVEPTLQESTYSGVSPSTTLLDDGTAVEFSRLDGNYDQFPVFQHYNYATGERKVLDVGERLGTDSPIVGELKQINSHYWVVGNLDGLVACYRAATGEFVRTLNPAATGPFKKINLSHEELFVIKDETLVVWNCESGASFSIVLSADEQGVYEKVIQAVGIENHIIYTATTENVTIKNINYVQAANVVAVNRLTGKKTILETSPYSMKLQSNRDHLVFDSYSEKAELTEVLYQESKQGLQFKRAVPGFQCFWQHFIISVDNNDEQSKTVSISDLDIGNTIKEFNSDFSTHPYNVTANGSTIMISSGQMGSAMGLFTSRFFYHSLPTTSFTIPNQIRVANLSRVLAISSSVPYLDPEPEWRIVEREPVAVEEDPLEEESEVEEDEEQIEDIRPIAPPVNAAATTGPSRRLFLCALVIAGLFALWFCKRIGASRIGQRI